MVGKKVYADVLSAFFVTVQRRQQGIYITTNQQSMHCWQQTSNKLQGSVTGMTAPSVHLQVCSGE